MQNFMAILCRSNGDLLAKKYFVLLIFLERIREVACTNIMTSYQFERCYMSKMSLLLLFKQNTGRKTFFSLITWCYVICDFQVWVTLEFIRRHGKRQIKHFDFGIEYKPKGRTCQFGNIWSSWRNIHWSKCCVFKVLSRAILIISCVRLFLSFIADTVSWLKNIMLAWGNFCNKAYRNQNFMVT